MEYQLLWSRKGIFIMKNRWQLINDNIIQEDKDALISFLSQPNVRFTQSEKVREFEKKWSEWVGVKHSVFINSGASGNYIMVSIMKELKGKGEVIVPPVGWISDVAPLVNLGMIPVFVDVNMTSLSITVENIKRAINENTVGITLVHALGFNAINEELIKLAKDNDLFLIEDCCESHGAKYNGQRIGVFGDVSNFSFYFGHHMTTIEGGMVCTNDDKIYDYIKMFRSHGMIREASQEIKDSYSEKYPDLNPLFTFAVPGYNMRSCELNAVVGLSQIKRLDSNIEKRVENLETWLSHLNSEKYFVAYNTEGNSNFSLPLILKEANKERFNTICKLLEEENVEFRKGTAGGGNQSRQPYLNKHEFKINGSLANADHIHDYGLYIGNHTEVEREQIENLCKKLNEI